MPRTVTLLCLLMLLSTAGSALAAPDGAKDVVVSQDDEEARGFFIAGRAAYVAGHFDEALARFEHSYQKSGRPELLYNIGAAAERAGQYRRAVEAYDDFLAKVPGSEHAQEAQQRLAALRLRTEPEPETAQAPVVVQPAPARTEPIGERPRPLLAPSLVLSTSGLLLVSGATLVVLGRRAHARVEDAPDGARWSAYRDDAERAPRFTNVGISLLAVGAVGAMVSGLWLPRALRARRSLQVAIGDMSVACTGSF